MKVLKNGLEEKVIQCFHCNSILSYNKYDIVKKDDEIFGEWHHSEAVKCPICNYNTLLRVDNNVYNNSIKVKLKFPEKYTKTLYGAELGIKIWDEQVKPYLNYSDDKITIIFPKDIEDISINFIEGFRHEYGATLSDKIIIQGNESIKSKFKELLC